MASTARAYAYAQPRRRTETPASPDFRVLPGRGADLAERIGASPLFFTVLKVVVAAVMFLAVVGICRVALNAATVQTMISADGLDARIAQAKSLADDLEVQETVLSNPARIKAYASENLGMGVAVDCGYIDLAAGALATDSDGNLSLAGSVGALKTFAATSSATMTSAAVPGAAPTPDPTLDTTDASATDTASAPVDDAAVDSTSAEDVAEAPALSGVSTETGPITE